MGSFSLLYVNASRCSHTHAHARTHTARKSFIIIKVKLARAAGWVGDGGPRIERGREREGEEGVQESPRRRKRGQTEGRKQEELHAVWRMLR